MKDNTIKYRCKNYRHHQPRCPAYSILDKDNNIIKKIIFIYVKEIKQKLKLKKQEKILRKKYQMPQINLN